MSYYAKNDPKWQDGIYVESWMEQRWEALPQCLREVALKEFNAGNKAIGIQKNWELNIIVLSLEKPPQVELRPQINIAVHTRFEPGNYCYDGTKCVYVDIDSGSKITFEDPNYVEESF